MNKKVLLVDDDQAVLDNLKKIIKWDELSLTLIGEANDGMHALEIFKEYLPDVVITDIKMPLLDGIEFVEIIRNTNQKTQVILLTAYDDFVYARKAIDLKVEKYFLKSEINESKINELLQDVCETYEMDGYTKHDVLKKILFEVNSIESVNMLLGKANIRFKDAEVLLLLIENIFEDIIAELIDYVHSIDFETHELFYLSSEEIVLFLSHKSSFPSYSLKGGQNKLRLFFEKHKECFCIGSSKLVSPECISKEYLKLMEVKKMRIFYSEKNLLFSNSLDQVVGIRFEEENANISELLRKKNFAVAKLEIRKLLDIKIAQSLNCQAYEACIDEMIGTIFIDVLQKSHSYVFTMFRYIHSLQDIHKVSDYIIEEIDKIEVATRLSHHMRNAVQYINEHCTEDITLEILAEMLSLNSSYLSQLFKKELSKTFKQYLNEQRINLACQLITAGYTNMEWVAYEVGYNNTNYFYKMFKRIKGVTPGDYK